MRAYPHQLSGGQQQRVVIAMALLSNPRLLILDEPTTALDVTVEAGIVALVKDLTARSGTSSLFISHNLGLILESCDSVTVMYSGEAVETGRVRDVFGAVRHPYTQGLFRSMPLPGTNKNDNPLVPIPGQLPLPHERPQGCNFGPRCGYFVAGVCDQADVPMLKVAEGAGHMSRCLRVGAIDWSASAAKASLFRPVEIGPDVLDVTRLKKHYRVAASAIFGGREARAVKAVEDVSFSAREAEVLAIVGESGCGKSTLAKVLLGLETATEGLIVFDHDAIQNRPTERRPTKMISAIQMIFQNPFDTLNPSYSVGSQIIRTLERFRIGANDAERRETMLGLLDLVKLPRAFARRSPRQLSGGQKQRIGVARAFAGRPRVIIADEPMSALDVSVQAAISDLLIDSPARIEDDHGLHQPRSLGGALSRRPDHRDVSRPCRRDGGDGADLLAPVPSLHRGAAVGNSDRRREGEEAPRCPRGRDSLGPFAAEGLPVPDALRPQIAGSGKLYASARSPPPARWPTATRSSATCPRRRSAAWSRCSRKTRRRASLEAPASALRRRSCLPVTPW